MYAAHQTLHILVGFLLIFFILFVIFCALCNPKFWKFLWNTFGQTLILVVATIVIRTLLLKILGIICVERLELRYPRMYQYWAHFNLIFLSFLAAAMQVLEGVVALLPGTHHLAVWRLTKVCREQI